MRLMDDRHGERVGKLAHILIKITKKGKVMEEQEVKTTDSNPSGLKDWKGFWRSLEWYSKTLIILSSCLILTLIWLAVEISKTTF